MKVIITAGGTGGHIYPALGVIEKLSENKDNDFLYIGTKDRMESELIPSLGIKYEALEIYGLTKNMTKNIKNIKCLMTAYKKAKKIIKDYKPDYVIGFGGYVTLPVLMAAHKYKIRTGIHEQNKIPGKTNKILSKIVDTTFVSFESSKTEFSNKVIYSGNPCAEKASQITPHDKTKLGFNKDKKLIIIVMGSLGSETVNKKIIEFLKDYKDKNSEILFITGKNNYEEYKHVKVPNNIKIVPFYNDLSGLMKSSDLIISRAGASTISEILAVNIPSILVPSPYVANNHQYYNALDLKEQNISIMLEEKDLNNETLKKSIDEILKKEKEIKNKIEKLPKLKASTIIVEEIKK